ncbi:MAG: hypothetical protein CMG50_00715 [Candidatus Marinimicrobia bacterium]|nr:hypothetical protein [Candidatus Neomarinimicrobiota bacterium]|tara:strand:- start:23464 stop:24057 length:594 start_codon:yes stop_codon:yes gene_type:complete
MKRLLISLFLYSLLFGEIPNSDFDSWNVLQNDNIWIGNFEDDFPWCKAKIILPFSIEYILPVIEDVNNYHEMLHSVIFSTKDKNNIAHIRIDYPFPFTDREYIVKFERLIDNKDVVYAFATNPSLNKTTDPNYIRLVNAKGEWRLSPIKENVTEVSYLWNGELRGDFPDWALSKAWVKHGNEVLDNLADKLKENNEK